MHEQLTQWWEGISLRSKITGVTVLVVTVGLLVVGMGTLTVLQRTLVDEVDRQLLQVAEEQVPQSPATFSLEDFASFDELTPSVFSSQFYFGAVAGDGVIIDDNVGSASRDRAPDVSRLTADYLERVDGGITVASQDRTTQWRVATFPLAVVDRESETTHAATLVIGADLADTNGVIGSFASIFLGFGLVVVILSAALTRLLVTSTFRPLRDVEATAARFAGGEFSLMYASIVDHVDRDPRGGLLSRMYTYILSSVYERPLARTLFVIDRDALHQIMRNANGFLYLPNIGVRADLIENLQNVGMVRLDIDARMVSSVLSVCSAGLAITAPHDDLDTTIRAIADLLHRSVDADVADTSPGKGVFYEWATSLTLPKSTG